MQTVRGIGRGVYESFVVTRGQKSAPKAGSSMRFSRDARGWPFSGPSEIRFSRCQPSPTTGDQPDGSDAQQGKSGGFGHGNHPSGSRLAGCLRWIEDEGAASVDGQTGSLRDRDQIRGDQRAGGYEGVDHGRDG